MERESLDADRQGPQDGVQADDFGWLADIAAGAGIGAGSSVKYAAIAELIAEAIGSGRLAVGTRLPPQRDLATRLGVTVATVTKAIAELIRLGLVETRRGAGTFVAHARARDEAQAGDGAASRPRPPRSQVDLAVNRPLAAIAAPFLEEALASVAHSAAMTDLFGYEPVGGDDLHRRAGARWLGHRGIEIGAEEILVTQGGNDGLMAALIATCRRGDAVACEESNYSGILRLAQFLGLILVPVALDEQGMRPESLEKACRDRGVRTVLCTPVTHNPTMATMSGARRSAIAEIVRTNGLVMIEDDLYGHLVADREATFLARLPEQTVYVTSLSKCMAAGLRVGFLAAARSRLNRIRDALYMTSWTAPSLHAGIAAELIESEAAGELVAAQRDEALSRMALARKIFGQALAGHGAVASYHAWLRLAAPLRAEAICAELLRWGIVVSPASHFAIPGSAPANAMRISLGTLADRGELAHALNEVASRLSGEGIRIGAIA